MTLTNSFADNIMHLRYSWTKENGEKETWEDIAKRVTDNVLSIVELDKETKDEIYNIIADRKFIPGGRFLAQSGRLYHQTNNCFCLKAEDSREGWGDLAKKSVLSLMAGGGIGINYSNLRPEGSPLKRAGGTSSGVIPAVKVINEIGRGVMAGGKRRSAIWAGLQWDHQDIDEFIKLKNWIPEVRTLKEKNFDFPATADMTNISVILDKPFFDAYNNPNNNMHQKAQDIYWKVIHRMLKTGEPGFSVNYKNSSESLRNACFTYDSLLLTKDGYKEIGSLAGKNIDIIDARGDINNAKITKTGEKETIIINLSTNNKIKCTSDHKFMLIDGTECDAKDTKGKQLKPFLHYKKLDNHYTSLGFMQGDGGLGRLISKTHLGVEVHIGKNDDDIVELFAKRKYTEHYGKTNRVMYIQDIKQELIMLEFSSESLPSRNFPLSYDNWTLYQKASFLRGCFSANGTINNHARVCYKATCRPFIEKLQDTLEKDFDISSYITTNKKHNIVFSNGTYMVKESYDLNIAEFDSKVIFNNEINFYQTYKIEKLVNQLISTSPYVKSIKDNGIEDVFDFSLSGYHWGVVNGFIVHNCCEIVSDRDSDVCCLGSINLPQISSIEELKKVSELGIIFLLAGTEYSDVPYTSIRQVREDYRRLGMGIMGIHEWLILHGHKYEENEELASWLDAWKKTTNSSAKFWANKFNMNEPVAKRAIAPNGSISIAGGMTTSGIEPMFSRAFQRRYVTPTGWKKQYVVDFVAERLYSQGINIDDLEDAYTLSLDVEKRIKFQSFIQKYVDNSISSTINIPKYKKPGNDNEQQFGEILYQYLPGLRGITIYPDGARGGQPLTAVDFKYALERKGVVFEGHEECGDGICGL